MEAPDPAYVVVVRVCKESATDRSLGYGYVNFLSQEDGSKTLYVARAQKKAERQQILQNLYEEKRNEQLNKNMAANLYVKNINEVVDDSALRELFSQCGDISSVKIMHDNKGMSKGFGFVCFRTPEEANKAVNTLHGYMFHGKPLYVAIAQGKEDRQAKLQAIHSQRMAGITGSPPAIFPAGYPPVYYSTPDAVPRISPQQGLMYPPFAMRPGWSPNGFLPPSRPTFQPMLPTRLSQATYMPPNGVHREMSNGGVAVDPVPTSLQTLSSKLAAASPEQQKIMLGERLFPLVKLRELVLASKITGMLLEMDNSELLLLLNSPDSLYSKVDEALQVLARAAKLKADDNCVS